MDDAAARRFEQPAIDLPGLGRQVNQHLASRGRRAPQTLRHIRCGTAAERPHVERRQLRVGHHHADRFRRSVQLFGNDLRERCADVLTNLGLARENADLAVFADVKPGGDVPGSLPAASTAPAAAARLLLGMRRVQQMKNENAPTQRLQESAAIQLETVVAILKKLVAFGLNIEIEVDDRIARFVHRRASFNVLAAPATAARIRGYVPQRQILPFKCSTISSRVGLEFLLSRATPDMIIPQVQ